jgi:hypothetical protein
MRISFVTKEGVSMILNKLICVEKSSVFFLSSIKLSTHLGDVDVSHFTRLLMVVCGYISDLCLIFEFFTSTNFTRAHRSKPTYIASTSPASVDVLTLLRRDHSFVARATKQSGCQTNRRLAPCLGHRFGTHPPNSKWCDPLPAPSAQAGEPNLASLSSVPTKKST